MLILTPPRILLNSYIITLLAKYVFKIQYVHNLYVYCNPTFLYKFFVFFFLHINFQAKYFVDFTVVDFPDKRHRSFFSYNIFSLQYNSRFIVNGFVIDNMLPSVTNLFPSSNWIERECWDMFGVLFVNHPDLRRILTDYGFHGHPLNKDFPLVGFVEVRFDFLHKCVSYYNIHLVQEYRFFSHITPWSFFY